MQSSLLAGTKLLVMTGGTSGFGRHAVERLLSEYPDWRIALLARPSPHADALAANPKAHERLTIVPTDLASLGSVAAALRRVIEWADGAKLDALALNAGVQAVLSDQETRDGLEISFGVNHLAHYLIVERLLPWMKPGGRVVITASEVHDPEAFCMVGITRATWQSPEVLADPKHAQEQYIERVDRGEARYCASKLLNVMHVRHLAQNNPGLSFVAFNPSVVPGTDIARERNFLQIFGWKFIMPILAPILPGVRSIRKSGGDLLWWIAEADMAKVSGQYVNGRTPEPGSAESRDPEKITSLIDVSQKLLRKHLADAPPV